MVFIQVRKLWHGSIQAAAPLQLRELGFDNLGNSSLILADILMQKITVLGENPSEY